VAEQLMVSFVRSLIIYFTTPLLAANVIQKENINSIEKECMKDLMGLPNDINRNFILHVA
jgi:hypothetical protein